MLIIFSTFYIFLCFISSTGLTFEIAEGGFLDIDVKIIGPDKVVIYQGDQESSGKYMFAAHTAGVYTYCFSNQKSSMTPKVVMFNMDIGEKPKSLEETSDGKNADGSNHNKIDDMIKELSTSLWGVKSEQEYMQVIHSFGICNLYIWFKCICLYYYKYMKNT